jgi:nucleotide-binding universal stress UspA family protein
MIGMHDESRLNGTRFFLRVLVATDVSSASDRVIACLPEMQRLGVQQVVLMHALGVRDRDVMRYDLARLIAPRLEKQRAELEAQGFEAMIEVAPGHPASEVNRIAVEKHVALVVIGSHGSTLAREILLGGVVTEILHRVTLPVLVFKANLKRPEQGNTACPDLAAHILYPTDFSDTTQSAFFYVEHLVRAGVKRVTLLHVQDRSGIGGRLAHRPEESSQIGRERLQRLEAALADAGAEQVICAVRYGSPIQEILRIAGQHRQTCCDGQPRMRLHSEVFLGSVSHHIARRAAQPVLLVPAVRAEIAPRRQRSRATVTAVTFL